MLIRTHLVVSVFFALLFLDYFVTLENKVLFFLVAVISTFLPDIDSKTSKLGRKKYFRFIQFIAGHRKWLHSFVFLGIVFFVIYLFSKVIAFGFLLGYGTHLFGDALTLKGIKPLYPLNFKLKGFIKSGGFFELILFFVLVVVGLLFIYKIFV